MGMRKIRIGLWRRENVGLCWVVCVRPVCGMDGLGVSRWDASCQFEIVHALFPFLLRIRILLFRGKYKLDMVFSFLVQTLLCVATPGPSWDDALPMEKQSTTASPESQSTETKLNEFQNDFKRMFGISWLRKSTKPFYCPFFVSHHNINNIPEANLITLVFARRKFCLILE